MLESRNFTENELCLWYFSRNLAADLAVCYFKVFGTPDF